MSRFPVLRKTIRDYRIPVAAMALVAVLIVMMDLAIYPSYRDSLEDFEMPEAFEAMIGEAGSITTPAGFLAAEFFSWIPLLFITVAIIAATGTTAGEEASGTMDLLLAQPISRRRLLAEKAAGIAVPVTLGILVSLPAFAVMKLFVEFDVTVLRFFEGLIFVVPLVLLFGAMALWAGVTFDNRGAASMTVIGVLVFAYFLHILGATVSSLDDVRKLSPFYWSDASLVLVRGFQWGRAGGVLAVAMLFFVLALWSFERRDIAAGRREWNLRKRLHRQANARRGEPPQPQATAHSH